MKNNIMIVKKQKLLLKINFSELLLWDVKSLFSNIQIFSKFNLVGLGGLLKQYKNLIELKNDEKYKLCVLSSYGNVLFHREIKDGVEIKSKKLFKIKENTFIYSRLGAHNGSFDFVRQNFDGYFVTNEFPTFEFDNTRVKLEYLKVIFKAEIFWKQIERMLQGAAHKRFSEEKFLNLKIPLPSLPEQNKIVENYNQKIKEAQGAESKVAVLEKNIEKYLMEELGIEKVEKEKKKKGLQEVNFKNIFEWGADKILNSSELSKILFSSKFENKEIKELAFINPRTEIKKDSDISFIPMKFVSDKDGEIVREDVKKGIESKGYTKFRRGDLIWAKITPCMQNGKSAVVNNIEHEYACGSTEFYVIRNNSNDLNLKYLHMLLRLDKVLLAGTKYFTGGGGQQRVPKIFLEKLKIPFPPLLMQEKIVEKISAMKEEIKELKKLVKDNRKNAIIEFEKEIFSE